MIISINDSKPYVIGFIKLEIPSMKKILNILDPTTLPIAISVSPFLEATTEVTLVKMFQSQQLLMQ